ncbi:MAG TPA: GNAT family N-acetyltransferase [Acidimicrobiales bacterium]|nr:GNAT family N-acetyltransferase [Acidimicrobiales bacterium]
MTVEGGRQGTDLLLDNAVWHALGSGDARVAESHGDARRYRPDVSVFYGVDRLDDQGWAALAELADAERPVVLFRAEIDDIPPGWTHLAGGNGHQMVLSDLRPDPGSASIRRLNTDDVPQMMELIHLTRPGPFLAGTIELGSYCGVFEDGRLMAMAGERMHLPGLAEISAVCTHPDIRRRGLGAAVTRHVAAGIIERGEVAFLHVAEDNDSARRVYEQLGFVTRRIVKVEVLRPPVSLEDTGTHIDG